MKIEDRVKHLVNEIADKQRKKHELESRLSNINDSLKDDDDLLRSLNLQIAEIEKIDKLMEG